MDSLRAIIDSIEAKNKELREWEAKVEAEENPALKQAAETEAVKVQEAIAALENQFVSVAGGVELAAFVEEEPEPTNLQAEAIKVLEPILSEVRKATAVPREMEALKSRLAKVQTRARFADKAVSATEALVEESQNGAVRAKLEETLEAWRKRQQEAENEITVITHQLQIKEREKQPFLESTRTLIFQFFRSRGMNLLIGLSAFILSYALMRFLYKQMQRLGGRHAPGRRSLGSRLADVIFHLIISVASLFAMILVFYLTHDVLLLALTLVFIVGICWGGVRFLPGYMEQLRLMLNIGSVREGERLMLDGLPWRVEELRSYSVLTNDALSGGTLRLPIKMLIGVHSRPCGEDETWFPCEKGDRVRLDDGTWGRVVSQSPEMVCLEPLGRALVYYQTPSFLALHPQNLSKGFRVSTTFGIDYRHQPESTEAVPRAMREHVREGLLQLVEPDQLVNLEVNLLQAASSSLDYEVAADFEGTAAALYEKLQRAITALLVESSHRNGWSIPFNQLTIHQA